MMFRITRDDVLKSKVLPPEWYPVEITAVDEKPSKNGDSMNTTIEFTIIDGPCKGAKVFRLFSEKAPGFAIPFLEALGVQVSDDGGEFDFHACIGKKIAVFVDNEMYDRQLRNKVDGFRSL